MHRRHLTYVYYLAGVLAAGGILGGCRGHMPHAATWPGGGDIVHTHAKPPEGGYYGNWDPYAVTIDLEPATAVNPVRTQHVLVATVRDKDGKPLPNRRVEWIISEGSVGEIVEVDESGWRASRGYKVSNSYAVSHTNNFEHTLTRGNDDSSDDLHLGEGQTWCVITAPIEGATYVTAYCPGIYDWNRHKAHAVKHWADVDCRMPVDAVNPVGTTHSFTTTIMRHSDGSPLAGYVVNYRIVSGPAGTLQPGGGTTATVMTDAAGAATVTLAQVSAAEGVNELEIDVVRPANEKCCQDAKQIMSGRVSKRWVAPRLEIRKEAPAERVVGQEFEYRLTVSNPSPADAMNVTVADPLPDGIEYLSSSPQAAVDGRNLTWNVGNLGGNGSATITVRVRATRVGKFSNCADARADGGLAARACADTVVTAPQLAIEMECVAEAMLCETIPYLVKVVNTGDATATNALVTVHLPEGMKTEDGRDSVSFRAGDVGPGRAKQGRLSARAAAPGRYVLTAVVTADGDIKLEKTCETVVRQPVLAVTKTGPQNRFVGRPAVYEITVANTGDTPAQNTVLTDAIPPGMRVTEVGDNGEVAGDKVRWMIGTLAPGASRTVRVTMVPSGVGAMRNTATATAVCAEAAATHVTTVEGIPAILLEVVDLEDPIEVGAQTTYEITVTNQGSADGTKIEVVCELTAEQEFVSATGRTAHRVEGKIVTFEPLPKLAPADKAVYRVTVKGIKAGDVRFRTVIRSDQAQTPIQETESTHIYD